MSPISILDMYYQCFSIWSSRQRDLPPPPLTEPYVKLSLHTAPIVKPKDIHSYSTSRRAQGLVWRYVLTTFLLCDAFL